MSDTPSRTLLAVSGYALTDRSLGSATVSETGGVISFVFIDFQFGSRPPRYQHIRHRPPRVIRGIPKSGRGLRSSLANSRKRYVKKLKHEAELFKAALLAGIQYAEGRKAVEFEATDSASEKALYVYRLLVHDKVISPMPENQVSEKTIRHRLAAWYAHQLPDGHPLLE